MEFPFGKIGKKVMCALLLVLSYLMFSQEIFAQYVVNGGTPARVKWMQVEGKAYRVVYPQGADSLAKRYLWLLEGNSRAVMLGLGGIKPAKIPVVLYNRTANSNGMVVWAPKRMELYTLPVRYSYPQRWEEQLALHESRHVGQMTHFTKGVYNVLTYLLGQQGPSIGVGLYPSRWFLEGDAVVAETELSSSGRGRNAQFMEYYRTAFLEGDLRNWDRWRLGSYRKYTPSWYSLGYLVNSTIRYKTGKYEYSGEIFEGLVKNFYNPGVIGKVYRGAVGMKPQQYLVDGENMMIDMWQRELELRGNITEPQEVLQKRDRGYQEYLSPAAVGKDSILYIKYSYNNPARLVLVSAGKEQVARSFPASATGFRASGGKIWFTENIPSSRWSNEVYSRLYSYNWSSGKDGEEVGMKKLSGRSWYASPALSEDGKTVLVTEYFPQGGSSLALLDSSTGELKGRIESPFGGELRESVFFGDDIYALAITGKGLGLFRWSEGEWQTVVEEQNASITALQCGNVPASMFGLEKEGGIDVLYFLSDVDGVRNVYMLEPEAGKLVRLTNDRYGASEPHIADGMLYYSSLGLGGKFPVKVALEDVAPCGSGYEPYLSDGKLCGTYRYEVAEVLSAQARAALEEKGLLDAADAGGNNGNTLLVDMPVTEEEFAAEVQPRKFSKWGNLFRFHSWAPLYYDVERIMEFDFDKLHQVVGWGATAYSQNTLGTAVSMLGYSYHKGLHAGHFKFKYTGWWPAFQIGADVNADERYRIRTVRDSSGAAQVIEPAAGPLVQLQGLVYVPLKFNSHGWQRGITPQVSFDYDNNGYYDTAAGKYLYGGTVSPSFQFYVMRERAYSAIYPKWGLGGVARWKLPFNGGENFGSVSSLYLYGYLPGLHSTHGFKFSASLQRQNAEGRNYWMGNLVGMPRGYSENFYCKDYFMGSADYALPIYLGDFNLWELAYVKRLQLIPFADYAIGKSVAVPGKGYLPEARLYSAGSAVLVDLAPFKFGVECSVGVRYSYNGNNAGLPGAGHAFHVMFSTALP